MKYKLPTWGLLVFLNCIATDSHSQVKTPLQSFMAGLDSIRIELKIPAMAVGFTQGDTVHIEEGFGYADLENHVKATANTSFRVASITKTFTSTLIMQQVELGKLRLETPISTYGLNLGNPHITVKNLLTHTSEEEPGTHYQYNGYRFGILTPIIEKASGVPFYQLMMENIVIPLKMASTAPGISLYSYFNFIRQHKNMIPYFETAFKQLAKPYELNEKREIVASQYFDQFGAFGGLVTTVKDLLKYSAAIDKNQFVSAGIQKEIFTPNKLKNGELTPYGLGWFTQTYRGIDFYWHYGQTQGESGLFIKVPSLKMTLVVLTNIEKLSQPFPLADGDLFVSPVGQLLYKYCINKDSNFLHLDYHLPVQAIREKLNTTNPYKDFYNKELITQATMALVNGDTIKAKDLYEIYGSLNFNHTEALPTGEIIAAIKNIGINKEVTKTFTLSKATRLRVYGVGENCSGDFNSWCDYGWIEDASGKMIWQMQGQPAKHAGGALKNQKVDQEITLPAGSYFLHYKSDEGHAYNNWDSAPPDNFFWGIILYN
ncbi:CubicO group peptidase, beta-lactamase class C family [Chitinophaga sp. YR573]|uniref:serine hydrolase domain-containing protein n=1 Tax=Chitinophaga sp. YR573 TaxID=1881040 RepID=UPI0008C89793|nr:serine hydrolase domain-containing protein [Chitinophaga sp. YR573]SEW28353.1 CubicO group peptidase, beta-lactamase class C family [Chitinophaga sp. YR573]